MLRKIFNESTGGPPLGCVCDAYLCVLSCNVVEICMCHTCLHTRTQTQTHSHKDKRTASRLHQTDGMKRILVVVSLRLGKSLAPWRIYDRTHIDDHSPKTCASHIETNAKSKIYWQSCWGQAHVYERTAQARLQISRGEISTCFSPPMAYSPKRTHTKQTRIIHVLRRIVPVHTVVI